MSAVWRDDFGSGTPQLSPTGSPNITSGYIYQNHGVNSGNYALVNKFNYFPSWHVVPEDHTPEDINGYFLVIDGKSTDPIFYRTTVSNVCPLTQYSFSTFAMNIDLPSFSSNQTFTFIISDLSGNQLATWDSPPIAVTNTPVWVPMGFSFNSGNNTALRLEARFNATGYDDFAFDDFQFSVCGPALSITTPVISNTCADSVPLFSQLGSGYANPVYQWQKKNTAGIFVNIPGATGMNYTDMLPGDTNIYSVIVGDGSLACPITENEEVIISTAKRYTLLKTICNGASFEGYNTTGNFIDTFTASNGCDSIRTLRLTVDNCSTSSCTGSFGNPVVNITFGSGATNPGPPLSAAVPGTSTNYNFASYATGTPPNIPIDGDYALLNQVPANGAWYTGAKDHTGNTNGYMAFFNASPIPSDFYRQTVSNLCPGTTYEFSAWVANVINPAVLPGAILPNITFRILDPATSAELATFNTGDIPNENRMVWKQYSFLFTSGNSSVTLVLSNNNIGGNAQPGNDLAIDDITFKPCGPLTKASFSASTQIDSTGITGCSSINLFGNITGSFNNPSYQWQISNDDGATFTDIPNSTNLNTTASNLANGEYIIRLLSAESGNITSTNCRFISNLIKLTVSNCNSAAGNSYAINKYAAVSTIVPCNNTITVDDPASFNIGDTVVIMQMKGAGINTTNSSAFGTISNYNNAGSYEFNYVKAKSGNSIELKNILLNRYDAVTGRVQLIRVPYYQNTVITDTLTCIPWNGSKGGVVILNSAAGITLNAPIDVSKKGFRGGGIGAGFSCGNINQWAAPNGTGGTKGEGITEHTAGFEAGGARLANGGGGAYSANTGGGGGANFGAGGIGGFQSNTCGGQTQSIGGEALDYSDHSKVFMGGGGGGGQQDDGQPVATGGNGGGIVIVIAATLIGNNQHIIANGENVTKLVRDEGGAGGGAGGSVLLQVNNFSGNVYIEVNGGDGSSNNNQIYPSRCHGPGAGGGGGYLGLKFGPVPPEVVAAANGGKAGFVLNPSSPCFNTTDGAADGLEGGSNFNIVLPEATVPFVNNNRVVVNTRADTTICESASVTLTTTGADNYAWSPAAGLSDAAAASPVATPGSTTKYFVTGTNTAGCSATDSVLITVKPKPTVTTSNDTAICRNTTLPLFATGGGSYLWSPAATLNNATSPTPVASPGTANQTYYVTVTGANDCSTVDSVKISVRPVPTFKISPDKSVCSGSTTTLNASGGNYYLWTPAISLNNPSVSNPASTATSTTVYTVIIKDTTCNDSTSLTAKVTVLSLPDITVSKSNDINCVMRSANLEAAGASQYLWSPATGLNNNTSPAPIASPKATITYTVKGTGDNGCSDTASITVTAMFANPVPYDLPNAFTPNGDGINDCFGIKYIGWEKQYQLTVYNRWGELVFFSDNVAVCWNGTYKGKPAAADNYVYYIKITTPCGPLERKGNVLLIR